jgi:DNA-binding NarL/FixJ family response regulator
MFSAKQDCGSLPIIMSEMVNLLSKRRDAGMGNGSTLTLLLVDDHPLMRSGVRGLLDAEPDIETVGECDNGATAIDLARKLNPAVVVMDVSLPQLGGAEATKQILQAGARTRVLALSAHEEVAFARLMLSAGATGYVLKRSACEELVRGVRVVAQGGTYVDPSLAGQLMGNSSRQRSPSGVPIVNLSEREAEVIRLIAQGHTAREIAQALGLSPRTLETYKARGMSKLKLQTRADLIRYALRCGWLSDV